MKLTLDSFQNRSPQITHHEHRYKQMQSLLHSPRPLIMGILNKTPDSFYDGGRYMTRTTALARAHKMVNSGADIIDVGGESTRPGADPVSIDEECSRIIPLIEALVAELDTPISIDTRKTAVMREALRAGVSFVNDVNALRDEGALECVAKAGVPVCIMHAKGSPKDMQLNPFYNNVLEEVYSFLQTRIEACIRNGMSLQNIVIDPGFGFGKNLEHNLSLLRNLSQFKKLGCPILVSLSRKHMIGVMLNAELSERLYGSISASVIAAMAGATLIRTHDVSATKEAMTIVQSVMAMNQQTVGEHK